MSMVVRVAAPTGRDAQLIVGLLTQNGIEAEACDDPQCLLESKGYNLGPLLLAEECLTPQLVTTLGVYLQGQPSWSDLPVLILTTGGHETDRSRRLGRERLPLGSPVLLERPIRTVTLLSSVRAAVRARGRQYEVRAALEERDRAAAELKAERETLQAVLDSMPVGIVVAKPSGEVVLSNPMLERILRHPMRARIAGDGWTVHHADGHRLRSEEHPLARAMSTGVSTSPEDLLYQRGDGTSGWVRTSASPVLNESGVATGGVIAIVDIDEEKRAAETLRRSEERFRRLIESASVGVLIGDIAGGVSYVNPTLLRLLGYTVEDVENGQLRWDRLTPHEYGEVDQRALDQLRVRGVAEPYQKAFLSKDGRPIPLLLGAVRIPSSQSDDKEEVAVFLTDLTSQKQAEAALIQSEKLAAVGRLAASISHEINNPLEAVTNLLYLAAGEEISTQAREYMTLAAQELARVSQIAGQTLRFHRQSTKPRSVTPQELLESVLALYQGRMLNARVRALPDYIGEPHFVCYEGDIRQVLNNLVGNAIDAMRGDGTLRVRSRAASHPATGVEGVRITVSDTGHGMSPETLHHIFEPFYTTKGIHGTGLGLWISSGIVAKHHGDLRARSSTGGLFCGTVFSLFLPLEPHMAQDESQVQ
jgi:PAS domain S-box-containing protein